MKISALRISNYKGFADSGLIQLGDSWNVVVGQNNSGKTALIEGFRLSQNPDKPHRNISFEQDHPYPPRSLFTAHMAINRTWLKNCWLRQRTNFALPVGITVASGDLAIDPDTFWEGPDLHVQLTFSGGSASSDWPAHRLLPAGHSNRFALIYCNNEREITGHSGITGGKNDDLPIIVNDNYRRYIYVFEAKRFALGESPHEDTATLAPDASNLPSVLIKLAGNPDLFREFNQNVSTIFPSIKGVTATTKGSQFEVRIWPIAPSTRRDDLSIPLNESGTGVGQVLAILYVAMTNAPGVIAIDEPNSFLHPGAAKKLIQILRNYPQHQYIISTHSTELIGEAQPAVLHLVRFDGMQSVVETFAENEIQTKRLMLEEVGASLSDVFGSDRVIWVEGPTERECFDLITNRELGGPIPGLSFVALRNTGDLDGKQADAALDIYASLTRGGSILPVSLFFSFDREAKTPQQLADLYRRCGNKARFLPRRMTENYLLSPGAIADVLRRLGENDVDPGKILELLQKHAPSRLPNGSTDAFGTVGFLNQVDGANILADVFKEITDSRHTYRKVRDGLALLHYILVNERESVDELVEYVERLLRDKQ